MADNARILAVGQNQNMRAAFFRPFDRGDGIGRFARLGNADHQRFFVGQATPVNIFAGGNDGNRNFQPFLKGKTGHRRRMQGSTAGDDFNPLRFGRGGNVDFRQQRCFPPAGISILQQMTDDVRLFVNFLQHKMRIPALADHFRIKADILRLTFDRTAVKIVYFCLVSGNYGYFTIVQINNPPHFADNGRNIAGNIVLVFAQSHDQRRVLPHGNDLVRFVLMHDTKGKRSFQPPHSGRYRRFQRPGFFIFAFKQIGIGFGRKDISFLLQLFAQRLVIFDNAVMHQRQPAVV